MKNCPICESEMKFVFSAELLNKYKIDYFYCQECGLLQTEHPFWLQEAYNTVIANSDTGLVARNIRNRDFLEPVLFCLFDSNAKFVDIGGGYGLLTRLMRDIGFDFYHYDEYCENLFAEFFTPSNKFKANCITAFEVLEHIENPLEFIKNSLNKYDCHSFIFSTTVFNQKIPQLDWEYYSFSTGQHITFYQSQTLKYIASKLGLTYSPLCDDLHIMSTAPLCKIKKKFFTTPYLKEIFRRVIRYKRKALTYTRDDCNRIKMTTHKNIKSLKGNA